MCAHEHIHLPIFAPKNVNSYYQTGINRPVLTFPQPPIFFLSEDQVTDQMLPLRQGDTWLECQHLTLGKKDILVKIPFESITGIAQNKGVHSHIADYMQTDPNGEHVGISVDCNLCAA